MIQIDLSEIENRKKCCGCGACVTVCPKKCISMVEDAEGFLYPLADGKVCIECGLCDNVCPIKKQDIKSKSKEADSEFFSLLQSQKSIAYAVMNTNENIRLKSSSGGMFTLLAEQVLSDGGYVFGAVMSKDCKAVHHVGVNVIDDLEKLRGSKYLQSIIGDVYMQVKELLAQGRGVLFSGTPCQIEGLRSYLGKEYEKLLCVDFICHGCPSPKVWRRYVDYRLRRADETSIRQILFRHKHYGWKEYVLLFEYSNNKTYIGKKKKDLYMKAFLNDSILRPSCHVCRFKSLNRGSDITLADFWGIQNMLPEMDDDKGTSLVILHSVKGKEAFSRAHDKMRYQEVNVTEAIKYNPSMIRSARPNRKREAFFMNLERMEIDELVNRFVKTRFSWKKSMTAFLKKIGMYDIAKEFCQKIK